MSSLYFLRHKNTIIGTFEVDLNGQKSFKVNKKGADSVEGNFGYPLGLYPISDKGNLEPVKDYVPTEEDINFWIAERVVPSDREGLDQLLRFNNMFDYDEWSIAVINKGITLNDTYWFSDDPNEKFENVHPKMKVKSSKNTISSTLLNAFEEGRTTKTKKRLGGLTELLLSTTSKRSKSFDD